MKHFYIQFISLIICLYSFSLQGQIVNILGIEADSLHRNFTTSTPLIYELYNDDNGNYWYRSDTPSRILHRITGDSLIKYNIVGVKDIFPSNGSVWLTLDSSIVKISQGSINHYNVDNSPIHSNNVRCIIENNNGVWLGTNNGLGLWNNNNYQIYDMNNSLLQNDTITALANSNQVIAFGTNNGLTIKMSNLWINLNTDNSVLQSNKINKLKWIGNKLYILTDTVSNSTHNTNLYYWENGSLNHMQAIDYKEKQTCDPFDIKIFFHRFRFDSQENLYFTTQSFIRDINNNYNNKIYRLTLDGYVDGFDLSLLIWNVGSYDYINNIPLLPYSSWNTGGNFFINTNDEIEYLNGFVKYRYRFSIHNSSFYNSKIWNNITTSQMDINNIISLISHDGVRNWDNIQNSAFEVPACLGLHGSYASAIWIGAYDQNGELHINYPTYYQSGFTFTPGPLTIDSGLTNLETMYKYKRNWKISREQIENFIFHFENGNITNGLYDIPDVILTWPAHGDVGFAENLAPFNDFNNDGIYNPMDGDYPSMRGDMMIYSIFSDPLRFDHINHSSIEFHHTAYAYQCNEFDWNDSRNASNNSIFHHFRIFNRSQNDYDSVMIGTHSDFDLGWYNDDFVGSSPENNMYYVYNGNNYDGDLSSTDTYYGENPPMNSIVYLSGPTAMENDEIDNNNNGIIDEENEECLLTYSIYYRTDLWENGNPLTPQEHYNFMRSRWRNGENLVNQGNGYGVSGNPVRHIFSGAPFLAGSWSEYNLLNEPGDRRIIGSAGPFQLHQGEEVEFEFAEVFSWEPDMPNGHNTSWQRNLDYIQYIRNNYQNPEAMSCLELNVNTPKVTKLNTQLHLFPNPNNGEFTLSGFPANKSFELQILDISGRTILQKQFNYQEQINLDLSFLESNIYIVIARGQDYNQVRKMVVTR